jgi:hypothetical protein
MIPRDELLKGAPAWEAAGWDEERVQFLCEILAERLGGDIALIKPCVACIGPQEEGCRGAVCYVLAVEYLRTGAPPEVVTAILGEWASRCFQPPRASHSFTPRDVASIVKSVVQKHKTVELRGYGCKRGTLRDACPYGGGERGMAVCPYIRRNRRPPKRDRIATLLGAYNLARAHKPGVGWKPSQTLRRRYLMMVIGALEAAKGWAGVELITSGRELECAVGCSRSTVYGDLRAMAAAGWIEYTPGLSRTHQGGGLPRGARTRRLLPVEWAAAQVKAIFQGAEEVE